MKNVITICANDADAVLEFGAYLALFSIRYSCMFYNDRDNEGL